MSALPVVPLLYICNRCKSIGKHWIMECDVNTYDKQRNINEMQDELKETNKKIEQLSLNKCRDSIQTVDDNNIADDSYQFDLFEHEYNTNKQNTQKIVKETDNVLLLKKKFRDLKYRELNEDEENLIDKIFELSTNKIVGHHKKSNIEVHIKDLNTLKDGQWLNDEIINFYMALLQDRNLKRIKNNICSIRVLFMNTFFYTKLTSNGNSYNYKSVKRWTKKTKLIKKGLPSTISNIFELDKLIFPVHINNIHWFCGCINFKNKSFEYYDSMSSESDQSSQFFNIIKKYILDEYNDKLNNNKNIYNLDLSQWSYNNNKTKYPQQQNGVDCGVFTSKCADWISDDLYPDYSQKNMTYFRKRMIIEIIRGETLDF